jgi:hypothetical protein
VLDSLLHVASEPVARKGGPVRLAAWSAPPGAADRRQYENLRGEHLFPPQCIRGVVKTLVCTLALLLFVVIAGTDEAHAAPPGTIISNQASLDYLNLASQAVTLQSNEVQLVTAVIRSPSTVQLTRLSGAGTGVYQEPVGPAACLQGGAFVSLGNPSSGGQVIDPNLPQDIGPSVNYNLGEPFFLRLDDSDQNVDAAQIDYAVVTVLNSNNGDGETVRLTETAIDSGIFAGFIASESGVATTGD